MQQKDQELRNQQAQFEKEVGEMKVSLEKECGTRSQTKELLRSKDTKLTTLQEWLNASDKKIDELMEEIKSKEVEINLLKIPYQPFVPQSDLLLVAQQLYVSYWEKVKSFYLSLQPAIQFLVDVENLSREVCGTIEEVPLFIIEKVLEAEQLLGKLYTVLNADLAKVAIDDQRLAVK